VPDDPQKPTVTSGIRIGTPAMTTRGFKEVEAEQVAALIADALENPNNESRLKRVAAEVRRLCDRYPVYRR
jgi:glycine hydroxymethyltransferase